MDSRALRAVEDVAARRVAHRHQRRLAWVAARSERVGRAVVEENCGAAVPTESVALLGEVGAAVAAVA